jgi:hypothetical protein
MGLHIKKRNFFYCCEIDLLLNSKMDSCGEKREFINVLKGYS